jgi:hypothetical protein
MPLGQQTTVPVSTPVRPTPARLPANPTPNPRLSTAATMTGTGLKWITPGCVDTKRLRILVVGPSGVGKTSLLRTIPENERVCTVSVEGGLLSVRDMLIDKKIQGVEITEYKDIHKVLQYLESDWVNKFDWVFIDSLTELATMCYGVYYDKYQAQTNTFGIWNDFNEVFNRLLMRLKNLPKYHIVLTCLESIVELSNKKIAAPDIPGERMKKKVLSHYDEVFFMEIDKTSKEGNRIFTTRLGANFSGKDRSGVLNSKEPADLGYIKNKIMNSY